MTDVGLVIYDSQMCNLKNPTVCFMHLECAIYKSQICNLYIANVRFKPQAEQNSLLQARTLIKFGRENWRESHSCFQQWRKDLAKKSLISRFESYI